MAGYPVIWEALGESATAGHLDFGPSGLTLLGGQHPAAQELEIGYDEIVGLGRATERLGRLRALRVDSRDLGTILIAAFNGAALNSEILERLQIALAQLS